MTGKQKFLFWHRAIAPQIPLNPRFKSVERDRDLQLGNNGPFWEATELVTYTLKYNWPKSTRHNSSANINRGSAYVRNRPSLDLSLGLKTCREKLLFLILVLVSAIISWLFTLSGSSSALRHFVLFTSFATFYPVVLPIRENVTNASPVPLRKRKCWGCTESPDPW